MWPQDKCASLENFSARWLIHYLAVVNACSHKMSIFELLESESAFIPSYDPKTSYM